MYQGANTPIIINLDADLRNCREIALTLSLYGNIVKTWDVENLRVEENKIIATLTQEETLRWECGRYILELKWLDKDGVTIFANTSNIIVKSRIDKFVILSGAKKDNLKTEETNINVNVETSVVYRKGYSPYIANNGNWYEWDTETEQFVDTNVKAQGKDAEFTEEIKKQIVENVKQGIKEDGYIVDKDYNHTDNNYSKEDKEKLDNLENYNDTELKKSVVDNADNISKLSRAIPTKTSQLVNDNNMVIDSNYVHTDNNYTKEDKEKLDGLENYNDTEIKADIKANAEDVSQLKEDISTLATKTYVDNLFETITNGNEVAY